MGVGKKSPNWTHLDFGRTFHIFDGFLKKIKLSLLLGERRDEKKKKKETRKTHLLYMGANGDRPLGWVF